MSLTVHLAFQKTFLPKAVHYVKDPDMWVCGGVIMLLVPWYISSLEGKN